MKIIELLFYIINYFVELPLGRSDQLQAEARKWEEDQISEKTKAGELLEKGQMWYAQVGFALLAIFGVKMLSDWYYSGPDTTEDSEMQQHNLSQPSQFPQQKTRLY